jgi:adenylylsulfate kinase
MSDQVSSNVSWHGGDVSRRDREARLGQRGCTIWFTGLSGSGKSTVAVAVEEVLFGQGRLVSRLDGDNLRHGLNGDLGFSEADRTENIRRAGEVCHLLADVGIIVLASFVSPFKKGRGLVRKTHAAAGLPFFEVHVDCALEVAEARDPKGLYKKARRGELKGLTGIDQPYEAPTSPDLVVKTDEADLEACGRLVVSFLENEGILSR